jgi:hypothetical protein
MNMVRFSEVILADVSELRQSEDAPNSVEKFYSRRRFETHLNGYKKQKSSSVVRFSENITARPIL